MDGSNAAADTGRAVSERVKAGMPMVLLDLELVDLRPFAGADEIAEGRWSCTVCAGLHDARLSWVMSAVQGTGSCFDVVVCPSCALQLHPRVGPVAGLPRRRHSWRRPGGASRER